MTQEERKAKVTWLNRAFHAEKNARAWMAKLERDRSLAERISRNASESSQTGAGGAGSNSTEDYLIRLAGTQERLQEALHELVDVREEISAAIRTVTDPDAQAVLVRHYLAYEKFEAIAERMGYSERTVYRIYRTALEKVVIEWQSEVC
jgi:DNA-directed RNA polymerase specialized sigma24 family protein